jgi:predicted  nucleic acid-binding Zn-ribbon protein
MGATPESIVADATRKLAALNSYVENLNKQTTDFVTGAEGEIAALQAQIEERRKAIQEAKVNLMQASQRCDAEADRIDDILEFFSLDLPPSSYAETKR